MKAAPVAEFAPQLGNVVTPSVPPPFEIISVRCERCLPSDRTLTLGKCTGSEPAHNGFPTEPKRAMYNGDRCTIPTERNHFVIAQFSSSTPHTFALLNDWHISGCCIPFA